MKDKINEATDISFTVWGENKSGDHQASKGLTDEKSPKKSIEVTGDDVNPLYTLLNKVFSRSDKEMDGYPITRDESNKRDPYILIKYSSNRGNDNVIWIDGASNLNQVQQDSTKTMQTTTPKERRYSDTYGVDSLRVIKRHK